MGYVELEKELNMHNRIFAVKRVNSEKAYVCDGECSIEALSQVFQGNETIFSAETSRCFGYQSNAGFKSGWPNVPGGIEYFLSCGRGVGFPPGERIKKNPEIAMEYFEHYDRDVLKPFNAYKVTPYTEGCDAEVVWMFANPDQLSALILLHEFRSSDSTDNFFVSFASGCGSLFAQPFAQLKAAHPKAVIGCTDVAARPYIDKNLLSLAVSNAKFKEMLADTQDCFFHGIFWSKLKDRLK